MTVTRSESISSVNRATLAIYPRDTIDGGRILAPFPVDAGDFSAAVLGGRAACHPWAIHSGIGVNRLAPAGHPTDRPTRSHALRTNNA